MSVGWGEVFGLSVSPLELIARGTAMYLFLWGLFRVVIKRRVGALGMADMLVLVIIADAAQNGMAGAYTSVLDAFILVGTIVAWNQFFDWLAFRFPAVQRLLEPPPLVLVDRGRILWRHMRMEFISREELESKLREQGLQHVSQVERAVIEPDGHITIVKK
jgi:uncharacterized membrane protein YcaP (DUF421 family)